jgi:predicted nucleic acid-binding protein
LFRRYAPVVWWATPVEARSAFAREFRAGSLTAEEHSNASSSLSALQRRWQEILPSDGLRALAEELLDRYPLSAADALQLAAAYIWSDRHPFDRSFISADKRLLSAAGSIGFRTLAID